MEQEKTPSPTTALGEALYWLTSPRGGNNFYGRVLNGCAREVDRSVPTCGVRLDKRGRYVFFWNPEWFVQQNKIFLMLVMVHEAAHIVLRHVERCMWILRNYDDKMKQRLLPIHYIACDMAVNDTALRSMVNDMNKDYKQFDGMLVWPESRGYPLKQTYEQYFLLILEDLKKHGWHPNPTKCKCNNPGQGTPSPGQRASKPSAGNPNKTPGIPGPGSGTENPENYPQWFMDILSNTLPHPDWNQAFKGENLGIIERAIRRARNEARRIVRRAVHQTKKSRGTIPSNLASIIEEMLREASIPWTVVLFNLVKSEISNKFEESCAYPSIALLNHDDFEPFPGYQNDFTFRIVAAFDTSGSMSDAEVAEAYAELCGVLDTEDGTSVRLLHFDSRIQHEEELTHDSVPKLRSGSIARYGRGGTDFCPPLRYARREDTEEDWMRDATRVNEPLGTVDLVLLFTDGEAPIPIPELEPPSPLFWVITTQGKEKPEMRRVLHIT